MVDRSSTNGAHAPTGGAASPPEAGAGTPAGEPDRLAILLADLGKLGRDARYYAELRLDSLKLTVREALIASLWGVFAAIAGTATLVTAVVLLLVGIARGVNVLASNDWAGPLTTGLVALVGATLIVAAVGHQLRTSALARTREKYAALAAAEAAAPSASSTHGASHD